MDRTIIILAGGASSRMRKSAASASDPQVAREILTKPKAMLAVGSALRPFLDYLLLNIERAGYENVVIVVGDGDDTIRRHCEEAWHGGRFPHLRFAYVPQRVPAGRPKPLGTADALEQALRALPGLRGTHVTVCNSDNLYSVAALTLLLDDAHDNAMIDYDRSALSFHEERIERFAVITKDRNGFLTDIVEKPSPDDIRRARDIHGRVGVSMNIWRFSVDNILPVLAQTPLHPEREEKELPLSVRLMVSRHRHSVFAIPLSEHVPDLTSLSDLPAVAASLNRDFPA